MAWQTTTGSLVGTVVDQQNNPIEGAEVSVINRATGFRFGKQRTDTTGNYRVDFVPPGEYDITAAKVGYQPNTLPDFLVELNRTRVVKVPPIPLYQQSSNLPPPQLPKAINVLANVADAVLRGSATSEFIRSLPLAGVRSFDSLALLTPGVAPAPETFGANGPGIGTGVGTAGQFSVNGQRARTNNFTIDGSDNNDQDVGVRRQGFTATIPQTVESVQEFEISTLLADAEAGRNIGGQINVVSRSGMSEVHGDLYSFLTDSVLNARDFFDLRVPGGPEVRKPPFTRTQIGGAFGAPLIKNRLCLFMAAEGQFINRLQQTNFAVPTLAERDKATRRGDNFVFSGSPGPSIFKLYPLPNNPVGPYGENTLTRLLPASGRGRVFSARADYQFNPSGKESTLSARYNFTDDDTRIPAVENAINSSIDAIIRTQNFAITLNSVVSSRVSNQIRFSYGRTSLGFGEVVNSPFLFESEPDFDRIGNDGKPDSPTGPIGRLVLSPFSPVGIDPFTFPQQRANNTFQYADTFLLNSGKNSFKFGADIHRVQFNSRLERNYRAQLSYTSNFIVRSNSSSIRSGADFAGLDLASDIFQSLAITPDATIGLRFTEMNLFFNDNLRVHPRITFDFGLRYELNTVPAEVNNRIESALALTEQDISGGRTDIETEAFLETFNAQRRFVDGRKRIYEGDHNNFAPRFGFAIDLTGDGRTSLRGGYGLFYDLILGNIISQSRNVFPAFISVDFGRGIFGGDIIGKNPAFITVSSPATGTLPLIQGGTVNRLNFPMDQIATLLGGLSINKILSFGFTLPEKNLRTPYVHQYSLTLERSLFNRYVASISYVGTSGNKLIRFRTPNGGPLTPLVFLQSTNSILPLIRTRPIPELGPFTIFESSSESNYNSLQVSLKKPMENGFGFQLAYTYSHAIDEVSDIFDVAGAYALAQDELGLGEGLRAERGNASFDIRHHFTAGGIYELPFAKKNRILGGIELSGFVTLQTGQPYTVNSRVDINRDGNLTDRLDSIDGLIFSNSGQTRIKIAPGRLEEDLLSSGKNGKIGRNTFRAAGVASVDLALDKKFRFTDRKALRLRVEAFNLFNRTHFGIPARILGGPGFGSSVSTSLPARKIQFAVRYQF